MWEVGGWQDLVGHKERSRANTGSQRSTMLGWPVLGNQSKAWRRLLEGASHITWMENHIICNLMTKMHPLPAASMLPTKCALRGSFKLPIIKGNSSFYGPELLQASFQNRGLGSLALQNKERKVAKLVKSQMCVLRFLILRMMSSDKERSQDKKYRSLLS